MADLRPEPYPDEALIREPERFYLELPARFEPPSERDEDYVSQ